MGPPAAGRALRDGFKLLGSRRRLGQAPSDQRYQRDWSGSGQRRRAGSPRPGPGQGGRARRRPGHGPTATGRPPPPHPRASDSEVRHCLESKLEVEAGSVEAPGRTEPSRPGLEAPSSGVPSSCGRCMPLWVETQRRQRRPPCRRSAHGCEWSAYRASERRRFVWLASLSVSESVSELDRFTCMYVCMHVYVCIWAMGRPRSVAR